MTKDTHTNEESKDGGGEESEKGKPIAPGFGDDLNNWCARTGIGRDDRSFTCFISRCLDDKTTRYLTSFKNEFPDLDEFGMKFGGGKYKIHVESYRDRKKIGTDEIFYIDEYFNEVKKQAERELQSNIATRSPGLTDAEGIVNLVDKLLRTTIENRKPANDMLSISRMVNAVAEDNLRGNLKFISQARKKLMEQTIDADYSEIDELPAAEPANPLIDIIIGLIDQYAPQILGEGPTSDGIIATVKNAIKRPELQSITTDPAAMKKIIGSVNRKYGPDETRKLFGKIGFKL